MKYKEVFKFELEGLEEMLDKLDQIETEIEKRLEDALTECASIILHDAKRLAPVGTINPHDPLYFPGDLEASLFASEVKKTLTSMYIEIGNSPETNHYAVVQHEGFRHTKDGKLVVMTPGENTRSKGEYRGYMPGRKFLENAIKMNEKKVMEILQKALNFN